MKIVAHYDNFFPFPHRRCLNLFSSFLRDACVFFFLSAIFDMSLMTIFNALIPFFLSVVFFDFILFKVASSYIYIIAKKNYLRITVISFLSQAPVGCTLLSALYSFHIYFLPLFTHSNKISLKHTAVTKKMYIFAPT